MTIIKEYRKSQKLTQVEMAQKMGVSLEGYKKYERGQRVMPLKTLNIFLKLRGTKEDLKLSEALEQYLDSQK